MKLTKEERELIPRSYEQVGDMIIFSSFPKELKKKEKQIAKEFLKKHKQTNIIAKKTENFSGRYRLPKLKILAGEIRKETIHKENGIKIEYINNQFPKQYPQMYRKVGFINDLSALDFILNVGSEWTQYYNL